MGDVDKRDHVDGGGKKAFIFLFLYTTLNDAFGDCYSHVTYVF